MDYDRLTLTAEGKGEGSLMQKSSSRRAIQIASVKLPLSRAECTLRLVNLRLTHIMSYCKYAVQGAQNSWVAADRLFSPPPHLCTSR
ncbi:MAG: hypothetical protein ACKESB_02870 [Candidatus Hodgkinia cicadicola]